VPEVHQINQTEVNNNPSMIAVQAHSNRASVVDQDLTASTVIVESPSTTTETPTPLPSSEGKWSQRLQRANKDFMSAVKDLENFIDELAKDDPKLKRNAIEIHKLDDPDMNVKEIWSTIDILMDKQDETGGKRDGMKQVAKKWFQASVPIAKVCLDIMKVCPKVT
jgi:hypothetical protein